MTPTEKKKELEDYVKGKTFPFELFVTCSDEGPASSTDMPDEWVALSWKWTYKGEKFGSMYWFVPDIETDSKELVDKLVEDFEHSKDRIKERGEEWNAQ